MTNFWRAAPGAGPVLIRYADLLKFDKAPESAQYLPSLLAPGVSRLFREAVESLNVPHIYSSLVRGADWLVEYGRAGGPLQPDSVIAAVWEDAEAYLPRALDAAQRLQQWFLREALHEHLARRIAGGAPELALVGQLAGAGHLAAFCETVITSGGLADRQREIVAERLRNERYYSGQIHRAIAGKLLRQMAGGERKDAYRTGQWLNDEARLLTDHFVAAAAELWSLSETPIGRRWELRLEKYRLDGVEQYQSLLRVAWMLSLPSIWRERVLSVYHPDYREAFFAFCARRLKEEDFSEQRDFLRVLAQICKPYGSENAPLIEAIRTEDRSYDLAQYYANLLLRLDKPDVETIRRLQSVRPPPSLWGKLWR